MSSVDKMTIQGIRSFGPRDQDTQLIQFFTPVTLIVGANGSGKTTIIECLKYATTGDLPPLSKGGAFVFDPKLLDEVESKGRIKLFIRSINDQCVQVQKNLSVTQKAKKTEFRTLETIISRYDKDAKLLSTITSKCINADQEIVNTLGVSKAVLDNVIFCHQEDSNWPLSDGKTLKSKFDEIFSATKYIKALEGINKIKKEKQQSVKQFETERKHLEVYKKKSEELNDKIEQNNAKRENCVGKLELIESKLKPIEDALEEKNKNARHITDLQMSLEAAKNEKNSIEKQLREIESTIKEKFQGSDQELKRNIDEFSEVTEEKESQLRKFEAELRDLNTQCKSYTLKKSQISAQIGALENEYKNYLLHCDRFKSKFNILTDKVNFTYYDKSKPVITDDSLIRPFLRHIDQYLEDYDSETNKINFAERKAESVIEAQLNALRDKNSKIEQSITLKTETVDKNTREIAKLTKTLREFEGVLSIDNLNRVEAKIKDCELELEKSTKEVDKEAIQYEIENLDDEKLRTKIKLDKLNREMDEMHENTSIQAQVEMLVKDRKTRLESIDKIKKNNEAKFLEFFNFNLNKLNTVKNTELKQKFDENCKSLQISINSIQAKNKEFNRTLITNESKLAALNEELHNKENQFLDYEGKLQKLGDYTQFDILQKDTQDEQKSFLDEKGFLAGVEKTYTRFIKQLQTPSANKTMNNDCDKLACPVCMRDFNTKTEADAITVELKKYISKIPRKIADLDEKIQRNNEKYENIVKLTPIKEMYEVLKNQELPHLRKQIDELKDVELKAIRNSLRQNECELRLLEERKNLSDSLLNFILNIHQYADEIDSLDDRISKASVNMKSNFDKTLDEVKQERKFLTEKFNNINETYDLKRKQLRDYEEKLFRLKEKLNSLKNEKLTLSSKLQEQKQIQIKLNELKQVIETEKVNIDNLKEETDPLMDEIRGLDEERKVKIKKREVTLEERKAHFSDINTNKDEVQTILKSIKHFESVDQKRLNELRSSLNEINELEMKSMNKQERLKNEVEDLKSDLNRQEMKKRELEDNRRLREKQRNYKNAEMAFLELSEKVKDIDLTTFRQEKMKLEKKVDDLKREMAAEKAVLFGLDGTIKTLSSELNTEQYKNAFDNYKICTSDLRVLELAVQDLDKYFKALDRAIMNYHNIKMDEINKTIKHLWKQVYRGSDIDYIEIRSEDEPGTVSKVDDSEVSKRRTYNYRVVIVKGETVIDMRGRCSMGQKVLASIIIRLALADTFCLNCGILALDEPTTNLDRDNIESLASALVEIIKERSIQKNFQLIIITHDEDFVELLGRSDSMDEFYRVYKDERGFSRISRKDAACL